MPFVDHKPPKDDGRCKSPNHMPGLAERMNLQPGTHVWECPDCGKKETIAVSEPLRPNFNSIKATTLMFGSHWGRGS